MESDLQWVVNRGSAGNASPTLFSGVKGFL